jgi:RND family efflux transporter MFP subunit
MNERITGDNMINEHGFLGLRIFSQGSNNWIKYLPLILILSVLTGCGSSFGGEEQAPILLDNRPVEFMTEPVIQMDIENTFEVDGRVRGNSSYKLSFEKTGLLSYYNAYVGKEVKAGELLASIDISEVEYQVALAELKVQQQELQVEIAKQKGDQYTIKEAEIALEIQVMELEKLKEYFDSSTIIAEVDGIISSASNMDLGSVVKPGSTLITIIDTEDLGIRFGLNEKKASQVKVGDTINLSLDGKVYESTITQKDGGVCLAAIPEDIDIQLNISRILKVSKLIETIEDAVLVPKIGIYTSLDGSSRVQVLEENRIVVKPITLGIELDEYFQVLEGIEPGEQIIVK